MAIFVFPSQVPTRSLEDEMSSHLSPSALSEEHPANRSPTASMKPKTPAANFFLFILLALLKGKKFVKRISFKPGIPDRLVQAFFHDDI
jgi:hypothetical protein